MNEFVSNDIVLKREGGIAHLVFNRPQAMNALNASAAADFHRACQAIAADPTVRAVILRGEGRAFGVGGDLSEFREGSGVTPSDLIEPIHSAARLLTTIDAPVIASLHGAVTGGSLSLALICDLAIAAEGTRFNMAYANVATCCDAGGSWSLPRLVGLRNALQIALLSDTFDAQEALRLGVVNYVVPADRLEIETLALAERLASGPTLAYGRLKRLMRQSFETDLPVQLDAEQANFIASSHTEDFKEALAAFFAKRPAVFRGA